MSIQIDDTHIRVEDISGDILDVSAEDGPNGPIEFVIRRIMVYVERDELEQLQYALVNFLNTGYFNREG